MTEKNITVVNNTDFKISKIICTFYMADESKGSSEFGPILSKGKGSGTLDVSDGGHFIIQVQISGENVETRQFKSPVTKEDESVSVTLTLGQDPYGKGFMCSWKKVEWGNVKLP